MVNNVMIHVTYNDSFLLKYLLGRKAYQALIPNILW